VLKDGSGMMKPFTEAEADDSVRLSTKPVPFVKPIKTRDANQGLSLCVVSMWPSTFSRHLLSRRARKALTVSANMGKKKKVHVNCGL